VIQANRGLAQCLRGLSLALAAAAWHASVVDAHWTDDSRYPAWAQRGRIIYLDGTQANEQDLAIVEQLKAQGATPLIHAFTPHWPNDPALVQRLERAGIPVDVRVEGSLFFEDDHIDRFAFVHGNFRPGGWWYNHVWRTNYDWWNCFPESMRATTRRRSGDEKIAYLGHRVTSRREGSPLAPEHRSPRAKQIAWLLSGVDPMPDVPLRPYENQQAKDPKVPYPMLGFYSGLWYDNPSTGTSYDPASRAAWQKHFREKFGVDIWDPPSHPDVNVRREWGRFWGDAWAQFYLWRRQLQNDLLRQRGKPFCHTGGNFSFISSPHGTSEFYLAKRGIVDMPGPSEYVPDFCRARFHFLIKTMLAATHGRPAGKFYPDDLHIAETLAVAGTSTCRPAQAEFLAANVDLFGGVQPGARIAILFHVENNLVESHLLDLQELVDRITDLGYPYEVVTEDDLPLGADLVRQFPLLVICRTDLTEQQAKQLDGCLAAGARLLLIGDCLVEKPRSYDLASPPPWTPDRPLASALGQHAADRLIVDPRQSLPGAEFRQAIERLGGPGFRLTPPDPDVFMSILRQPKGDLTLVGLVNYSGTVKAGLSVTIPDSVQAAHAAWISRDGGAGMIERRGGQLAVPELRYGCTLILGNDRPTLERIVQRNAALVPPKPPAKQATKMLSALAYGKWHDMQVSPEKVPPGHTLCRHRVGSTDRAGYLLADLVAPKTVRSGQEARVDLHFLDTRYDHLEYWQVILEDKATGKRTIVPIALPSDNPYGEATRLRGVKLTATWKAAVPGTYQGYLAYRVTRVSQDGEPFLEPENVPAGYSGNTPANLFLKGQPLPKRPCEDRLRGLVIQVVE